eukprot:s630_g14.t1
MSVQTDTEPLTLQSLVLVDQDVEPYVRAWPDEHVALDGSKECLVLCLLRREDGILLAVPKDFLPEGELEAANQGAASPILGMSCSFHVPSMVLDGGRLSPTGESVDVVVVDCNALVVDLLRLVQPFEDIAFGFDPESTFAIPDPDALLPLVVEWIQSSQPGTSLMFYSATEQVEEELPEAERVGPRPARTPPKRTPAKAANGGITPGGEPKQKVKKPTTASLSASLENLMTAIPGLTQQLQDLSARQKSLEDRMLVPASASCPALTQPLSKAIQGQPLAVSAIAPHIQTPPRTGPVRNHGLLQSPALAQPGHVLELEKEKPGYVEPIPANALAQAVLTQSEALNNLVSQIAQSSTDPMMDLGGLTTSGTRGSAGRARLQADLASQKGLFFQSVMTAMARRMSPTVPAEGSFQELMDRGICGTRYLERFGGYARHRDLGMLQYQVMCIMDFLQTSNLSAARDATALLCVTLEQAVLENGRFELASVLTLQDDLPSSIFVNRQSAALSRARSFAPLADQKWITTALAYLKEMGAIQTKRNELSGKPKQSDAPSQAAPKQNPKRKGRGKGAARQQSQNDQEEEEA